MSTRLDRLKEYLLSYSEKYRVKHSIPETDVVVMEFYGNDDILKFYCRASEPNYVGVNEYWFNNVDLRICTANVAGGGLNNTYDFVTDYNDYFTTALYLKGEYIDVDAAGEDGSPPPPVVMAKGELQVSDGEEYVGLPVGEDGQVLIVDSAQPTGLRWGNSPAGIGIKWRGVWDIALTYEPDDIVRHKGQTYINTSLSTSVEPPNPDYWEVLVPGEDLYLTGLSFISGSQITDQIVLESTVPHPGYIRKVGVEISANRTDGNIRFRVTKNGVILPVTDLDMYINVDNVSKTSAEVDPHLVDFQINSGDKVGIVATSTDFAPLVQRLESYLVVQYG